ncbi:YDG domain-containing protein [Dyella sp. C9]|uniref:YDG domain-containing protein n=1 Tax=Dyella sp. C9 TaxID=2202154 RepID=UPI000DEF8930|nr:YDG domain-containing protein [Dyella sp. C9]
MNHIYRLCWNRSIGQWVVASELASAWSAGVTRTRTKTHKRLLALSLLAASLLVVTGAYAGTNPSGGQITDGVGRIQQSGDTTTIQQSSPTLQLNWQSFNLSQDATVDFLQPSASAIAVNRILSTTPSDIYGRLNANGQVWLINPSGILFGPSAQVNVGGIVASTLDVAANGLGGNSVSFSGPGKGSIVNQGAITAANGGYAALLANQVSNQGAISAHLGTVALAGGSAVTLTFDNAQLVHVQVAASTLNNLAENRQLLVADGGHVIMTAGAQNTLLASAVNNTGKIRAQTVENHDGTITLLGGMQAGVVNVAGTLDASAPNGGDGGSIETSAAQFHLAADAQVTAAAPHGRAGSWLVDPTDLTIDPAAATAISSTLQGGTSVIEQTTADGTTGDGVQSPGAGDINVNAPISWTNAAANLTLEALNAINVNAAINGAGAVTMQANGANLTIASGASIVGGAGVILTTSANFVNNAGSAAVSTGTSSPWLIYSTNPTLNTTGGLTPDFIQYNTTYPDQPVASGNGFLYTLAPVVNYTGLTGTVSKVYDGTTVANLTGANLLVTGLVNGDKITAATGSYATANAGTQIVVNSPTSVAQVTFMDSTGTIPVYGYRATGTPSSSAIGTITPAPLTATIINNPTKTYDGSAAASLTSINYSFTGFVLGQGATVNQASSVNYSTATAGTDIPITATFTSTNFVANSGTLLSNYTLPASATGPGTINPAPVQISGLLANDKVYDGTTAATLNTSDAALYGVISGDVGQVGLSSTSAVGNFTTPNVGTDISVIPSGFVLTGAKAVDYQIIVPLYLTADITPKQLTITGVTANNKVYDATTVASLNLGDASISGVIPSDAGNVTLSTTGATGNFSQSDVGNNLRVSASGMTLGGSAAGNYTLAALAGVTADITPAPLTITLLKDPEKVYDGSVTAVLDDTYFTVTGFVDGQSATLTQGNVVYATPNAGTGIPVTATLAPSDFTPAAGTSISNYTFQTTISSPSGIIDPAPLLVNIVNNPTKQYDGDNTAFLTSSNYAVVGVVPGETVNLSPVPATGEYATPNVGFQGVTASLDSTDFSAGAGTLLSNYVLPSTAIGLGTIVPKPISAGLNADIINNPSKTYDGTTVATIAPNDFTLSGFVGTDSAVVSQTITGQYASKNAGTQPVSATLTMADLTAGPGTDLNNYTFPVNAYGTGTIIPATLIVDIINNPTKVYNGDNTARLGSSNFQIEGFVSGEGATITPSTQFNYSSANAGNWLVSGPLVPSNYTANAGTLLTNYTLATMASGMGTITQAPLYIINAYATNKVYDTTTADTLDVSTATLAGLVGTDVGDVTLNTSTTGTFASANVGTGIAVTASGFSISGSAAGNYALQPIAGLSANITPAPLYVVGAVANNKVYDGTTLATINATGATLSGVLGTDQVSLLAAQSTGSFITANVGNNLLVRTSGFTLAGAQLGNYTLVQPSGLTANITPAPLTVEITGNPIKQYDGTTSVTLSPSDYTITGFVGSQSATVTQAASSNYLSPNVGTNIGLQATLEISDYVAGSGTILSNYQLPQLVTGVHGEITPAVINLTGTRVYDATTGADASIFANGELVDGVNGETLTLSGSGVLTSKNVGFQVPFANLGTLALSNGTGLASNYTLTGGTDWVTITPAVLTVLNTTAANKVYDGTTTAALSNALLFGVIGSDDVVLGNDTTGNFNNKNVGTDKPVSTSMTISGTDAGNYTLVQPTGITADITALGITVYAQGINKVYDGTTTANVTMSSPGVVAGDNITFTDTSANFTQADVGNNITINVLGIGATGADAGNYTLLNSTAQTAANITPFILNLTGSRVYDTTADADATLFGNDGVLSGANGETLTLSGTGLLVDKNVGNQKPFATDGLDGFTLTANGTAKVTNYSLAGGTDWVTITPATLTVADTIADSKVYDGTTTATLHNSVLEGVLGSDQVTLANDQYGQFNDKNVGTDKPVTTSMTLSGTDSGNYVLVQPTGIVADIYALGITVDASGINKVYDATTNATVNLNSPGVVAGDDISFTSTSANFTQSNVGNGITVNVAGISATGTDASNYTLLNTTASTTADITPYVLNLQGSRVYDALADADASLFGSNGTLTGVAGQTLTLSGTGELADKNVGTQKPFASNGLSGFTLTGIDGALASNYTLVGGTDWVTVTPATLTVIDTTVDTKVYDATTAATLSGATLSGILQSDAVTLGNDTSGTFSDKNAGTGKAVTAATMTISGTDAGNYVLVQPTGLTGTITQRPITVDATGQNKVYDGTTAATVTLASTGILSGDSVSFNYGSASFTSPNVGTAVPINVSGITGSGTDAGNYSFNNTATANANITPAVLNLTGVRVYDGSTSAIASLFGNNGVINGVDGETLTLSGTGTLSSKDVGNQIPFATGGLTGFSLQGNGTALASNYTLAGGIDWVTITPLAITVTATGQNKMYDGTTAATVNLASSGVLGGDSLTFSYGSANFTDPNVGTSVPINVSGISVSGTDAGDYTVNTTTTTSANITPYILNLHGYRVYDGTTDADASLFGNDGVLTGVNGETLTLTGVGTLASKNAGLARPFAYDGLNGFTLTGDGSALASNYTFIGGTAWVTITRKTLTVDAIGQDKVYDGTTAATVDLDVSGVVPGDNATFYYGSATFANPNVGANIPISVTGISGNGTDIGNYTFAGTASTSANITAYILNLTGTRVYDGTTQAAAGLFGNAGVLTGVNGETLTLSGTGTLSTKNVGNEQPFASGGLDGYTLTGDGSALASNYTLAGGIDWVTITPLAITLTATGQNKVYDGTTEARVTLGETGVLAGDDVSFNFAAANFTNPNVGNGIPILVTGITGSGADAGNYSFVNAMSTSANITPAILNLTGIRPYDGTTNASAILFGNNGVIQGVDGQTLTLSGTGTLSSKNAGSEVPFATNGLSGFTLTGNGGASASNYTLAGGIDWVTITPLALTLSATVQDKTYDTSTAATVGGLTVTGLLPGDSASFTYGAANFVTPNAGDNIPVLVTSIVGNGSDIGNYTYSPTAILRGNILPVILSLTGTRTYDGATDAAANLFGTQGLLTGIDGQTLTLGGSGTLATKNVGQQQPFASGGLSGFTLAGNGSTLASNYTLGGGIDWVTITPLAITISATGQNKTYDGNTSATVNLASSGIVPGDQITLSDQSAQFSSPNAGNNIPIAVSGITASGADAGNYTFNNAASTQANITPVVLNLTGIRVYDATTNAAASLFGNSGVLQGVNGETLTLSGLGMLSTKDVGTDQPFAAGGLNGYILTGNGTALASNYTLAGGYDWVTITPATLTVTGTTTSNRPYDGTTVDNLSGSTLAGVLGTDSVTLGNDTTGNFNDPNVGNDKPVNTSMTISGADAGNYVLVQPTDLTADITAPITPTPFVPTGLLASTQNLLSPSDVATPYGTADPNAQGGYTGNQKQEADHPLERNRSRSDFPSRLPVSVVDGGVRLPANAMP